MELREPRILVLLPNNEYEIFSSDEESLKKAVDIANGVEGVAIYRLSDYIRTDSSGGQEVSVKTKKIWPR
jgi:hypothetical protein